MRDRRLAVVPIVALSGVLRRLGAGQVPRWCAVTCTVSLDCYDPDQFDDGLMCRWFAICRFGSAVVDARRYVGERYHAGLGCMVVVQEWCEAWGCQVCRAGSVFDRCYGGAP